MVFKIAMCTLRNRIEWPLMHDSSYLCHKYILQKDTIVNS